MAVIQIPLCYLQQSMQIFSATVEKCVHCCVCTRACVHVGLRFMLPKPLKCVKCVFGWLRVLWPTFSLSVSPGKCLFPQWITFPIQIKTLAGRHAYERKTFSVFAVALLCWRVSQIHCCPLVVKKCNLQYVQFNEKNVCLFFLFGTKWDVWFLIIKWHSRESFIKYYVVEFYNDLYWRYVHLHDST